jgi:hypothetical protein
MTSTVVLAYAPFTSSPLNPSPPTRTSLRRQPRHHPNAKRAKPAPTLSSAQRVLRKRAADAWVVRGKSSGEIRLCSDGELLNEPGMSGVQLISFSIDEAQTLVRLDDIIGSDNKDVELGNTRSDADPDSLTAEMPRFRPNPVSMTTVRAFAEAFGTFCLYGLAHVHSILRQVGMFRA